MRFRLLYLFFLIIVRSAPIMAQNWTLIDTNVTHTTASLSAAYFVDDTTGYIAGGDGATGIILKTTNAGATWSLQHTNYHLWDIYFPSRDTGYAVGMNCTIMKTVDAGAHWTYQNGHISTLYWANAVCFINNNVGFIGVKNGPGYAFLKTTDGGINWVNDITDTVYSEAFSKVNDSTVFGLGGKLSKTTNRGTAWVNAWLPASANHAESVSFINENVGFATVTNVDGTWPCMSYGALLKTTDAGGTWQETDYPCGWAIGVCFPTDQIGYMVGGFVPPDNAQQVWKTTDQGNTWNYTTFLINRGYTANSILCTNANTCYILTNIGVIVKSTNGFGAVGITEEAANDSDVKIYPNPATDQITVEFNLVDAKNTSIEVKNILGQTVSRMDNKFSAGKNQVEINIGSFAHGLYFVQLQTGDKIISKKIIKE